MSNLDLVLCRDCNKYFIRVDEWQDNILLRIVNHGKILSKKDHELPKDLVTTIRWGSSGYEYRLQEEYIRKINNKELYISSSYDCPACGKTITLDDINHTEIKSLLEDAKKEIHEKIKRESDEKTEQHEREISLQLDKAIELYNMYMPKNTIRRSEKEIDLVQYLQQVFEIENAYYIQKRITYDVLKSKDEWDKEFEHKRQLVKSKLVSVCKAEDLEGEIRRALDFEYGVDEDMQKDKEKALASLKETIECIIELYSLDVIYPKYRGLIPVGCFIEYLLSGRTETLAGAHGAYNLYENENFARTIVDRLDNIDESLSAISVTLDQIKDSNHVLLQKMDTGISELRIIGEQLSSMNQSVMSIDKGLGNVNKSLDSLNDGLKEIKENTYVAAYYSARTAYNTEVIAHYTKQTAQLTNALGYLVAMK